MGDKTIKVLVVDDSALIRKILVEVLAGDPRIKVVGEAQDPYEARALIKKLSPDVLTLDIEMPKMNGIAFLKNLMRLRPMPVVMISTLTQAGAPATLEALELGAVDFLPKPQGGEQGLAEYRETIINKVLLAARANVRYRDPAQRAPARAPVLERGAALRPNFLCAIGASTGGTEAIKDVLMTLPAQCPPIVMAQHIPEAFSGSFSRRLDANCAMAVFEAEHDQPILAGCAYLAPGHSHLQVVKKGTGYVCKLDQGDLVNRHRPSVEVLYRSVIQAAGKNALGVLLTGMGNDGAQGLLDMREAGCTTIAQDQATCVVWGMPRAAVELGAAEEILPLDRVGPRIMQLSTQTARRARG
ncbi:chemotaxis response regulator protein-glutamate methylesterase [Exilibacterium tricleocarpae]|uniref:Protein-glutamate methylesterase/protein-glutamine glutaminase n=1 Tax=Exilibacterium tricleocarpae TaxID=2591008 RepID=A0A545U3W9_9GAMM|nr:chemotaxis response regulator protein-glutamate methylesterase [Exilibacterium tricleocarpae]TQV84177.1 chemotaxis response regulator protein-glutamate methylesterase [Exilibacterium tricleocarpae]